MGMNVVSTAPKVTDRRVAIANPSTVTTTTLVAAVAGKKYRLVGAAVVTNAANNVNFAGSVSGALSAVFQLGLNGGIVLPHSEHGWLETTAGEALQVTTSAATACGVHVMYIEINT